MACPAPSSPRRIDPVGIVLTVRRLAASITGRDARPTASGQTAPTEARIVASRNHESDSE